MHGDYRGAIRLIARRLKDTSLPQALRGSPEVQKLIRQRLPLEFPYFKDDCMAIIHKDIPDFTEEKFNELVYQRNVRWIYVKGEMRYFNRFYS